MANGKRRTNKGANQANLAEAVKPQEVILADGSTYKLQPLDINMITDFQDHFPDDPIEEIGNAKNKFKLLRHLVWLMMEEEYKLDEKQVGKLLTIKAISSIEIDLGM